MGNLKHFFHEFFDKICANKLSRWQLKHSFNICNVLSCIFLKTITFPKGNMSYNLTII